MQTGIRSLLWKAAQKLASVTPALPLLTGGEQTRLSWARAIESYDEVPEVFRSFFDSLPDGGGKFSYAVLTPTYEGFLWREKPKLICRIDNNIHILEETRNAFKLTCYPLEAIHCIEMGAILLSAWITIRGITGSGSLAVTTIKFNTVNSYLFDPILDQTRPVSPPTGETDLCAE
ncbi:MAG: hypothetical protein AB1801_25145, partial [Chloroflexota bacterium]